MIKLLTINDIYRTISTFLSEDKELALASVIKVEGSTPRSTDAKMIITEDGFTYGTIGGGCLESYVQREAKKVLAENKPTVIDVDLGDDSWSGIGMACGGKVEIFIEPVRPDPRLIILGSGHVAEALAETARRVGFRIWVADPFARQEDFPSAEKVFIEKYSSVIEKFKLSKKDSVVISTRHRFDEEALEAVLAFQVMYVGMLGSKNRVKKVIQQLQKEGIREEKLSKVYAPIGLDLGAETPEEIAISIMAEILKVKKGVSGESLSKVK